MTYNKSWMELNGWKTEEEARAEMARRGANSKGKPKTRNWLKDNEGNASTIGKKGAQARWGKDGRGKEG